MSPRLARFALPLLLALAPGATSMAAPVSPAARTVALPKPDLAGRVTLERALAARRSVREYAKAPLTLAEVSQLMWAAHGITGPDGKRTTPSARATYPLTIHLAARDVTGLEAGFWRYLPASHALELERAGDAGAALVRAAAGQAAVEAAPVVIVVAGDVPRMQEKYGERGRPWTAMEAGFVVQNVYLEAGALGLGTVIVGGFQDGDALRSLGLPEGATQALMPVGRRR